MENSNLNKSNKTKIIVIALLIILVSIASVSYAYFALQITGNEEASSMLITTANMTLSYTDVEIMPGDDIEPGWTDTKTLTVRNIGNVPATYDIIWKDLYNEVTKGELVISVTCVASSGSCPTISETAVPIRLSESHNVMIKSNIPIAVGVTHTYTVTIEFKETNLLQNYNQDKIFNGTLSIKEPVKMIRNGTDSTTGLPVVKIGTEEFFDITNAINYSSLDATFKTKINYDVSKSILLAKYNLYVGQNCTSTGSCTPISTSASGYGLQSADAKGYVDSSTPRVGVVPFSGSSNSNSYWDPNGSGINSKYGTYTQYKNNIYDTNYVAAPNYSVAFSNNAGNANYSIAYYVEGYVDRLGIEGIGRLLTLPEANAMAETQRTNGAWYWLGTATNADSFGALIVRYGALGYHSSFYYMKGNGVRPVIVVSTSDIQNAS